MKPSRLLPTLKTRDRSEPIAARQRRAVDRNVADTDSSDKQPLRVLHRPADKLDAVGSSPAEAARLSTATVPTLVLLPSSGA